MSAIVFIAFLINSTNFIFLINPNSACFLIMYLFMSFQNNFIEIRYLFTSYEILFYSCIVPCFSSI